jgi:hypothetical protein
MLKTYKAHHVWKEGKRYHKWGENEYPGVTTILSATKPEKDKISLNIWRNKVGVEIAENITKLACDRGSEIHSCIEDFLIGKSPVCSDQWFSFWQSIKPVLNNVTEVQLIEGALWHPLGFAGSVDCVANWKGNLSIIDWKTSSKPKKEEWILDYKLQTAGYCAAVNRMYNLKINNAVIVIALENIPAQVFEITSQDLFAYWQLFCQRVKKYHSIFKQHNINLKTPCKYCGNTQGKINKTLKKQYNKPDLILKSLDCSNCGRYQSFLV